MNNTKMLRSAFSMTELVFVIAVLGIVASISSSTIVDIFKSYIPQKASDTASEKTELAAMQIANRLSNAVPWSLTAKDGAGNFRVLSQMATGDAGQVFTTLEWIGIDNDGFSAYRQNNINVATWSGFCDTANATATSCPTNGSVLGRADTIMKNLSNGDVGLTAATQQPVIIFKNDDNTFTNTPNLLQYSPTCMGITDTAHTECAIRATATNATTIGMSAGNKLISEHYVLAWSAYAIRPENCRDRNEDGIDECDLVLYSNYQPWEGESYTNYLHDTTSKKSVLLNNVTLFKFAQFQDTIRFKLCVQQTIGDNNVAPVSICKEKVVIR